MDRQAREAVARCMLEQCSFCRDGCASYRAFGLESYTSRGKNRIVGAIDDGQMGKGLDVVTYACTACGQCDGVAMLRKLGRDGPADAAAGTGHERP